MYVTVMRAPLLTSEPRSEGSIALESSSLEARYVPRTVLFRNPTPIHFGLLLSLGACVRERKAPIANHFYLSRGYQRS